MTSVTPLRQSPLLLLQNAVSVCVAYEDQKNVAAESAQQQLGRVRALILQALAALGEPSEHTVEIAARYLSALGLPVVQIAQGRRRDARDLAAVITHHALTWGIGDDVDADAHATGTPR